MRLTRIYVAETLADRKQINLPEQASGHLTRVLRLGQGDALRVFDGSGGEYDAVIRSVGKRSTTLDIKQFHDLDCESPLAVTLLQGIARGERMDLIVQKATELGVQAIQPLLSLRSNVKLDAEAALRKVEHARKRIEASGRDIRLEVDGGIKPDNIRQVANAGADTFVAGSAIFGKSDYKAVIDQMRVALS
jgi:16S rRNA (uracil1498-N3)-methyltransferase